MTSTTTSPHDTTVSLTVTHGVTIDHTEMRRILADWLMDHLSNNLECMLHLDFDAEAVNLRDILSSQSTYTTYVEEGNMADDAAEYIEWVLHEGYLEV